MISGVTRRVTVISSVISSVPPAVTLQRYFLWSSVSFIRKLKVSVLYPPDVQFFQVVPFVLNCHWYAASSVFVSTCRLTGAPAAASTSSGCTVISGSEARLTVAASEVTVIPLEETRHRYILPSILAFIRKLNSKVLYPPEVQFFHVLPSVLYCHW